MGCRRSRVASLKKQKPRIARGPLLSKVHPPLERVSIRFAAFRSSNVIGINVALPRWIRRVAFFRTAARARSCGHPFFMLRFLARGSAGTDGSVIGHAGRGLALSRRNERRAEERRNDKSRDCKFGSCKKVSPRLQHSKSNWTRFAQILCSDGGGCLESDGEAIVIIQTIVLKHAFKFQHTCVRRYTVMWPPRLTAARYPTRALQPPWFH
jgi:hypothetical protein